MYYNVNIMENYNTLNVQQMQWSGTNQLYIILIYIAAAPKN